MISDFLVNMVNFYYNVATFNDGGKAIIGGSPALFLFIIYTFSWFYLYIWAYREIKEPLKNWIIWITTILLFIGDFTLGVFSIPMFFIYGVINLFFRIEIRKKVLIFCLILVLGLQVPLALAKISISLRCTYRNGSNITVIDNNISLDELNWHPTSRYGFGYSDEDNESYPLEFVTKNEPRYPYGKIERMIYLKSNGKLVAKDYQLYYSISPGTAIVANLFQSSPIDTPRWYFCKSYDKKKITLEKLRRSINAK